MNQEDEAVKNKTLCIEETAEKFNLNRSVLEDWLKIASRQFCCEFCSKGFAVRWRLTEHQKRLHFTKEEWAMSVEGRHQRQNVEKVKLDVMPSLEEMLTKKYINTQEQKVNQFLVLDLVQVLVLVLVRFRREYQMKTSFS